SDLSTAPKADCPGLVMPPKRTGVSFYDTGGQSGRQVSRLRRLACLLPVRTIPSMVSMFALVVTAALGAVELQPPPPRDAVLPSGPALTLSEAEQNALRYQTTLRQAAGQTEAAAGRVEEARSGYLPQLTGIAT